LEAGVTAHTSQEALREVHAAQGENFAVGSALQWQKLVSPCVLAKAGVTAHTSQKALGEAC
jgi:hypothetical protein